MTNHIDGWPWKKLPEDMPKAASVFRYRLRERPPTFDRLISDLERIGNNLKALLPATHEEAKAQGTGG